MRMTQQRKISLLQHIESKQKKKKNPQCFLQHEVMQCVDSVLPLKFNGNCNKESLISLV